MLEQFIADRVRNLAYGFSSIFVLAGENKSSHFIQRMHDFVADSGIIQSAMQLSRKLKTCLFSVYLDVLMIDPHAYFHEGVMESAEPIDEHDTQPARVSCTVELGLHEVPHPGEQGMGRILLKPKIVLEVNALSLSNLHGS